MPIIKKRIKLKNLNRVEKKAWKGKIPCKNIFNPVIKNS